MTHQKYASYHVDHYILHQCIQFLKLKLKTLGIIFRISAAQINI